MIAYIYHACIHAPIMYVGAHMQKLLHNNLEPTMATEN